MTHTAFDVFRYGRWLERVYYVEGTSAEAVRRELVEQASYPADITVHVAAKKTS